MAGFRFRDIGSGKNLGRLLKYGFGDASRQPSQYEVQSGDTLSGIRQQHNMRPGGPMIKDSSGVGFGPGQGPGERNPDQIQAGETLSIPGGAPGTGRSLKGDLGNLFSRGREVAGGLRERLGDAQKNFAARNVGRDVGRDMERYDVHGNELPGDPSFGDQLKEGLGGLFGGVQDKIQSLGQSPREKQLGGMKKMLGDAGGDMGQWSPEQTAGIQTGLKDLGYYGGEIDSMFGPKSVAALRQYQGEGIDRDTDPNDASTIDNYDIY